MDHPCTPLQRRGERNIFCSFYNGCLDYAIKESWSCWDCSDCQHKFDEGLTPEFEFFAGDTIEHYDLKLNFCVSASVFGFNG
jgi:hypothetical protein